MIRTASFRQPARNGSAPGDARWYVRRGGAPLAIAAALALAPMLAGADAPTDESAQLPQAEFIEFLEYLGSWDGQEDQWQQFLGDSDELTAAEVLVVGEPSAETASTNVP